MHSFDPNVSASVATWSCACGVTGWDIFDLASHANLALAGQLPVSGVACPACGWDGPADDSPICPSCGLPLPASEVA